MRRGSSSGVATRREYRSPPARRSDVRRETGRAELTVDDLGSMVARRSGRPVTGFPHAEERRKLHGQKGAGRRRVAVRNRRRHTERCVARLLRNYLARLSRLRPGEGRAGVHHLESQTGYDQQGEQELHPSSRRRPSPSRSLFLAEVHRRSAQTVGIVRRPCAAEIGSSLTEINTAVRDKFLRPSHQAAAQASARRPAAPQ